MEFRYDQRQRFEEIVGVRIDLGGFCFELYIFTKNEVFINISTDQVIIYTPENKIFLERNTIENTLGKILINLYNKNSWETMIVLNGPGGFTNLRVGTLAINLLHSLIGKKIQIYDLSKIQLYKYLFEDNFLPNKGIIYIGQRKKVWIYNLEENTYKTIKKNDLKGVLAEKKEEFFVDYVCDPEYFVDLSNKINIDYKDKKIIVKFQDGNKEVTIDDLDLKKQDEIQANYFIQPITGKQGQ